MNFRIARYAVRDDWFAVWVYLTRRASVRLEWDRRWGEVRLKRFTGSRPASRTASYDSAELLGLCRAPDPAILDWLMENGDTPERAEIAGWVGRTLQRIPKWNSPSASPPGGRSASGSGSPTATPATT